ncbi:MAG: flagellar biosynthetic protein FliO [Treponema sp.]|nr:flagellar biosynthetic protein FliO [Treponema sp.]
MDIAEGEAVTTEDSFRIAEQAFVFTDSASDSNVANPSIWAVVRMLLVLALAAAAIYGAVFFIKRTSRQTPGSDPFLKILASSHLGVNRYVHIVSVGSRAWLLGASDGGVNVISEIDDKETVDALLLEEDRRNKEKPQSRLLDFVSMLKRHGAPVQAQTPPSGTEEIRKRMERIKGL